MKYKPGGYSWLSVSPESNKEKQIEKIEDEIYNLRKKLEKSGKSKLLDKIQILEEKIKDLRKS